MKFYQLLDQASKGGLFLRGHTRKINTDKVLRELAARNITFVMNMSLIPDPSLEAAAPAAGIEYRHEAMSDSKVKVDVPRVRELATVLADKIHENRNVMVHCDAGWNRSSLIACRAIRYVTGAPMEQIIAEARAVRGDHLLYNKCFEAFLLSEP